MPFKTRQKRVISENAVRWFGVLSIVFGALSSTSIAAQTSEQYEQSLQQVSKQIKKISGNLNANKKLLKNERDKLAALEQQVAEVRQQQRKSQQKIAQSEANNKALIQRIANNLAEQQQDLKVFSELLQNRHKEGQPNYLKLLLNQQNPYAVGRMNHYYRYFSQAQQQKIAQLQSKLLTIQELQQESERTQLEIQQEQNILLEQADKLAKLKQQRTQRVAKLDKKVVKSTQTLANLKADRERLNSLLKQIAVQAKRLKELQRQREIQAAQQAELNETPTTAAPRPKRRSVKGGFKKQQGRLSAPVSAKLDYQFGSRLPASGMRAQGHFYKTKQAQEVAAVFRGNVLFADYLKGYGLLIIIDHGEDHISLYGHNEVLYKQVGEAVATGETVGKSGVSGGLKQPGLYFEIRHKALPVDPAKWLSR